MLLFRRLRLGDVALSLDTFVKSPLVDTRSVFMDTVSCQAEELFMQLPPSCDGRLETEGSGVRARELWQKPPSAGW